MKPRMRWIRHSWLCYSITPFGEIIGIAGTMDAAYEAWRIRA